MKISRGIFMVFLLFLSALRVDAETRIIAIGGHKIATEGLSAKDKETLKKTLEFLDRYSRFPLRIPEKTYEHYSRFKSLFGFSFESRKLQEWVLARITKFTYYNDWAAALNQGGGNILIGDEFLNASILERAYLLVHEARHSDSPIYGHVNCPEGFPFLVVGNPAIILEGQPACDSRVDGAYAFQAAFLYEVFARAAPGADWAGYMYSSTIARVLPLGREYVQAYYGEESLEEKAPLEYVKRREIIEKLNGYAAFRFRKAWAQAEGVAYISEFSRPRKQYPYTIIFYKSREQARKSFASKKGFRYPVFLIGSAVILCAYGDGGDILKKISLIYSSLGIPVGE